MAAHVPGLHGLLGVLEHDLGEASVVGLHHGGPEDSAAAGGAAGDSAEVEHSSDVEVIGELDRSVSGDEGHAVDGIPLLGVDDRGRVGELDCRCCVDQPVVVRPLRIRPRSARTQIPPDVFNTKPVQIH